MATHGPHVEGGGLEGDGPSEETFFSSEQWRPEEKPGVGTSWGSRGVDAELRSKWNRLKTYVLEGLRFETRELFLDVDQQLKKRDFGQCLEVVWNIIRALFCLSLDRDSAASFQIADVTRSHWRRVRCCDLSQQR